MYGQGTVFDLRLPAGTEHLSADQIVESTPGNEITDVLIPDDLRLQNEIPDYRLNSGKKGKPWILIVEDHAPVRQFIIDIISKEFKILQASEAAGGFRMAEEFIPDLIISDVMMPGIDGFAFCRQIKTSEKTSHIPVILLSARADLEDRLSGLEEGADDYITKPFNARELQVRILNLLNNRLALRKKFSSNSVIRPEEVSVTAYDSAFMEKIMSIVEENMANIQFTVEDLAAESGMSQSQLHRKLKAIINMPAVQFIRSVRMHRAMKLLQEDAGNISEVAYMVGYDEPGYFSKTFDEIFRKAPFTDRKK